MDINKICLKIKELGHNNSKREELREYCKLNVEQIIKLLPRRVINSDGGDLLDCIFNGLPDNLTLSKYKVQIIDIVLQCMRKESTSLTHCGDVISRLCLELSRQPAQELVRWSNESVQSIVDGKDVNMVWKDVLPECLSALSAHSAIEHCGTEMTVPEYKEQCIRTLCQCQWQEKQLVQLTAMFRDMQLARNDHKQVVNKICSCMTDIPPDSLPPLVHQLLKLCKTYHMEIVLAHLSHYFNLRLYSKLEPPPPDSDSTMDIDDIVQHSPMELSRCLSTCLYHVTAGAAEPEAVRRHIRGWPRTQLLRSPFLVDLALALADKGGDFRTVCLDTIRAAIEQRETEELKRVQSAWARAVLRPDVVVPALLKVITTESANHRQLTVVGLINLAFCLLGVSRVKPCAGACWSHGKLVLVRLSKQQPETAPHILAQLADKLANDNTQRQYAECLHVLCALTPVAVERCSQLPQILEACQPSPRDHTAAAAVLEAVHPLLTFSTRIRDALVMVCRKGLYSRDASHRCLALCGVLCVLKHVQLSRSLSLSQGASEQFSAHSYLTQIAVDVHSEQNGTQVTSRVRNEAMCMEVVSILRRCLVQDAAVKQLLYTKLYECAKEKTVLHESILELLYEQLSKYVPESDGDSALLFDKCVQITPTTAVLTEPISHLLYCVSQFICGASESEDILCSPAEGAPRTPLAALMDRLARAPCLATINVQEEPGLADLTPESKAKSVKVQQVLSCYEALVAYRVMQWSAGECDAAGVCQLFAASAQLQEQTKSAPKIGKKGSKTTLNETKETQKTQKSQKSQKDKGKAPVKVGSLVKDRAGPFKPLPCVWDLKFCLRILELLYSENVSWCSVEQRNIVRGKRELHQWAVGRVASRVAAVRDKRGARDVAALAALLYSRTICRFAAMCEFDEQTTLCCVDLFRDCLAMLLAPSLGLKLDAFLPPIANVDTSSACAAAILEQLLSALRQIDEDDHAEERDGMSKKLVAALAQTAVLVLETPLPASPETSAVVTKWEDYVSCTKQDCMSVIPALLAASYRETREAPLLDHLLVKLTHTLGIIDEEELSTAEDTTFPMIDSTRAHTVVGQICAHLSSRHKCVELLLTRARDLPAAAPLAAGHHQHRIDKELKELYKSIVLQLCELSQWTTCIAKLRCAVGTGSDKVLSACVRLYSLLGALAKHIDPQTAQLVRLDRLLKLSGKKLSAATDNLITYLEASQAQASAVRVLRDTKLIPRLVLEAELFTKHVILLANKANVNYQQFLSLGTARDFRIKAPVLHEALQAARRPHHPHHPPTDEQMDINDAETEVLSPASGGQEVSDASDDDDAGANTRKRRRVS